MLKITRFKLAILITTGVFLFGALILSKAVGAASGDLDPTFGNGGKVTTIFGGDDRAMCVVIQVDGKIVVAGSSSGSGNNDFVLTRYNQDGTLDTMFGSGGKVVTDFGGNDSAHALLVQPDGKLVTAGAGSSGADFALARYNTSGTLDTSFGTGGKVTTNFGATDSANALVIQTDGKLVAAGASGSDFALSRYNADGTLDTSFGTGGKITTDFGAADSANALVIQADGKLVAAGASGSDFALARYNANGTLDTFFGTGGKVITNIGADDSVNALVLQTDGELIAAGSSAFNPVCFTFPCPSYGYFALARYTPAGTLDPSFGNSGQVTTDIGGHAYGYAITIQADGKILVGGASQGSSNLDFTLARYLPSGPLDSTFGTAGKVVTSSSGNDYVRGIALQGDGKIVAAGFSDASGSNEFLMARYLNNPPNDNFASPQVISGVSGHLNGTNVGATKELSEPNHAGNAGGASVWYSWQAPSSGSFTFTTHDGASLNTFDTLLAVYKGPSLSSLTTVASNNDDSETSCEPKSSRVGFNVSTSEVGSTYYIAVDGVSGTMGSFNLRWGQNATITIIGPASSYTLSGDACRSLSSPGSFTGVPTGGGYRVDATGSTQLSIVASGCLGPNYPVSQNQPVPAFNPLVTVPGCSSAASLADDVTAYFGPTPNFTIAGTVTATDRNDVVITVIPIGQSGYGPFFTGTDYASYNSTTGNYGFGSLLWTQLAYSVTAAKSNYTFTCTVDGTPQNPCMIPQNYASPGSTVRVDFQGTPLPTPVITWNNPADITYGTALSSTQLNATANTPGTFTYSPAAGTVLNAGSGQTLSVNFTPTDTAHFASASKNVTINVLKANQTITFGALSNKTYRDAPFNVSASASSGLAVNLSILSGPATISDNTVTVTGAGTVTVRASQTGNSNYSAASNVDRSFTVNKATASVTLNNLSQTFDGNPKFASATTNPAGLQTVIAYSGNGSPVASPTNAGSYDVSATVNDANYQGSQTGVLVIGKATPVIAWNNPANIIAGTALSSTQLNATASVPGAFQYAPQAGTVLSVGTSQLSVTFTPTDAANYNSTSKSVQLMVTSSFQLMTDPSGPDPNQAAAIDAALFLRDPFPVVNGADLLNLGADRNTRVMLFVANLQLLQSEPASSVVVNLIDSSNQSYDVPAEDVRQVSDFPFVQVTFRLPDNLAVGTCTVKVRAHGQVSNAGTIRIRG